jgi:hypothetical protein
MTLDEIVDNYIREYSDDARNEMRAFEGESSPAAAIRKAALSQCWNGKRHPHQRRIPIMVLRQAEERLQAIGPSLAKAADFAVLHRLVEEEIGRIKGIGELAVYDIAHRVGAHFGKEPRLVYLHAGTRTGARGLNLKGDSVDPASLPDAFSRLSAAEIEDCLCIYKDELNGLRRRSHRCCSVSAVERRRRRCL